MSDKPKEPKMEPGRPARRWLIALGLLTLFGLADAVYLSVLHWQVHNQPGHVSFCAVDEALNCDTVALSGYSQIAGMPVSTWGALVYLGMLVLILWGWFARRPSFPFALGSGVYAGACGATAFLFLVSELNIQSYCIMCMGLYGVNLFSALVCLLGGRRAGLAPSFLASLPLLGLAVGATAYAIDSPGQLATDWPAVAVISGGALLGLIGLNLRGLSARAAAWWSAVLGDLGLLFASRTRTVVVCGLALVAVCAAVGVTLTVYPAPRTEIAGGIADMQHGHTPEGHAWIGSKNPEVTVYEYSDYECPFCGKAHEALRVVVRENKDWLRLVHVHMPLDTACNSMLPKPFHKHSCACARAAECAGEQDAFWQMNDRLFLRRGGLDAGGLAILAENMGLDPGKFRACMASDRSAAAVASNLAECKRHHVRAATPAFRFGGQKYMGFKKPIWWRTMAKRVRARAAAARKPGARSGEDHDRGGADGGQAGSGGR